MEIESITKKLPITEKPRTRGFSSEFYQILKNIYKKRILQTTIAGEYQCKNVQPNMSKLNSVAH